MIVYLREGVMYSEETVFGEDLLLVQGFSGIGYYHYFGPTGRSGFIKAGFGLQDWTPLDSDYDANDYGAGILLGGGYEFTPHVQVEGSLSFGKTSDDWFDYKHSQFSVAITAFAF